MASPVDSPAPPRRPDELLALARRRGQVLRRRRRALLTGATALAGAVVAAAVYLAVPGPTGEHVRTIAPAHPGSGAIGTAPPTSTTSTMSAGPATTTATSTPGPGPCSSEVLTLSAGAPSGSAGGTYYELGLANGGPSACLLEGFPGVSFLDRSGQQIGQPAQRMGNETVVAVRLAPGATGYVTIRVTDPGVWPCPAVESTSVRVYPPGQTQALVAPLSAAVCSAGHPAGQTGPVTATAPAG